MSPATPEDKRFIASILCPSCEKVFETPMKQIEDGLGFRCSHCNKEIQMEVYSWEDETPIFGEDNANVR